MINSQTPHRIHPLHNRLQRLAATLLLGSLLQMPATAETDPPSPTNIHNQVSYTYDAVNEPQCVSAAGNNQNCISNQVIQLKGTSNPITAQVKRLVDPLGQVTGCAGEILPDYTGFSVGLYEADRADPTGASLGGLVSLSQTAVPANPASKIPLGMRPNTQNSNPFFLTTGEKGTYNFLLDVKRGQISPGRSYILVINPPSGSVYSQRRIRIVIAGQSGNMVSYTATALDGKPLSASDGRTTLDGSINIKNAEQTGLNLGVLDFNASICQNREIQIIKTGDRAAAEPGDTVIYRLAVRNLASAPVSNLVITDTLPLGFNFLPQGVRAEFKGTSVPIAATRNGSTVTFNLTGTTLPPATTDQNSVLNIVYAAVLTPDAIRGSGQNSAIVRGQRADNQQSVKDGPAVHRLRIRSGIISDCGTIIGRVFVDKNFDGEQQPGEPGVPNAVVFMEDGNRITTDANGLFSVANVLPGYRTGVLDLSSTPGYTFAPNHYFSERNSQSRLVHLEPGGLVRMNFAVTPTSREAGKQ